MANSEEILEVLGKIHDLLVPISACFQEQYKDIQRQRFKEKLEELETLLTTDKRRRIFPLLFDSRRLSQIDIAKEAETTQPTVSRFVNTLLKRDLIEPTKDNTGTIVYRDKYDLVKLMEMSNEQEEQ